MSQSKVLMFLLSVFAMIMTVSLVIPEDGLELSGVSLQFPTASEIVSQISPTHVEEDLSPEEILASRLTAIDAAQRSRFDDFVNSNPARIHFPGNDPSVFDGFFKALGNSSNSPVRIMHYGDSQLEEDRITETLRDSLQARFGGLGPGLLPLDKYYTRRISEVASYYTRKYSVFGYVGELRSDGLYGPMGLMSRPDSTISVTVVPAKKVNSLSARYSRLTLLLGRSGGPVTLKCGQQTKTLPADSETRHIRKVTFELPDSSSKVHFSVSAGVDAYGVMLDGKTGVSVDNIAMRGCSGDVFTRIEPAHISEYADLADVRMVILQFGGNVVPYSSKSSAISAYCATVRKQILHLRKLLPEAVILFIGPSDMSTNIKGSMVTYPHLPILVDALKLACNDAGAAYWDMFAVMGGEGSMARWVKTKPALAGSDHIHFTRTGSEKMGEILYDTLLLYYDYYRYRSSK